MSEPATPPPNILVVMTDDHGRWAAGCYGNREVRTPTMDYLAETGVRFANAFTPTPVCSPARASFFTGRLPSQHGIHDYLREQEPEIGERDWLAGEATLARILGEAGYQTALAGKWHCGQGARRQPGFDYWFGLGREQGVHAGAYTYLDQDQPRRLTGNKTGIITDGALAFLRGRDRERPFFLFVGPIATHSPWTGHPERLARQYRDCTFADIPEDTVYPFGRLAGESNQAARHNPREARAQYYAAASEVDEGLGRLIDELDAQGLRERTLVVYTADHGLNCGHHGIWGKGNGTRPLNMVEESIRVPLICNHPGGLFPGLVRAEPVDHCDLFQTILEYAGVALPAEAVAARRYPGRSFAPLLRGGALPDWKNATFGEYGNLRMIRTRARKLVRRYPDGPNELFDLVADPRETTNLFGAADQQPRIGELTAALDGFFARHEDPRKSGLRVRELPRHNPVEAWREGAG